MSSLPLQTVPTLVIDDEADQAGLNNLVQQGDESTTYRRLLALRRCLPRHTFVQYTATPQAPLLINIIDSLSPSFAQILTPGPDYVGGRHFFIDTHNLVRTIPPAEIPMKTNRITAPPESLLYAMRLFFVGVAAGYMLDEERGNRSMMVHPSHQRTGHRQYFDWIRQVKEEWQRILELPAGDRDRQDLLAEFQAACLELQTTVPALPAHDVLAARLLRAIRRTRVELINSARGRTPNVDWRSNYAYILVGGQAMDRGFTVEGLTVTYMTRNIGVGNADTVQQRARFLGYKRPYLGFCRVFLEDGTRDAYRHYVEHEEDIRNQLVEHRDSGQPLSQWRRAFYLDRSFKPTRDSVLDLDYMRVSLGDQWLIPRSPHDSEDAVADNRVVVNGFIASLRLTDDSGHPERTNIMQHHVDTNVLLSEAYERLLTQLRITRPNDSQSFTLMLLHIARYLDQNPHEACAVYVMSHGLERERGVDDNDQILNLFQGAHPDTRGAIYRCDRHVRTERGMTIQIHNLRVQRGEEVLARNVRTIAVWIPRQMSADFLVQPQGGTG